MQTTLIFTSICSLSIVAGEDVPFLGLNIPAFQSISRMADSLGLGASGVLRGMHQQMLDMTAPMDDARVQAINKRDEGLQDHLQFMESAYRPLQSMAALAGSGVNRLTNGIDQMASTFLRPVTETANFLGRMEQQTLDRGTNLLNLGLISPSQ